MDHYQPRDYAPRNHIPRGRQGFGPIGMIAAWLGVVVLCLCATVGAYTIIGWMV